MNAIFLVKRLLVAGLSVVMLTLVAGAGAAAAARMETPGVFAPFNAATLLFLGCLAVAVGCGRRESKAKTEPSTTLSRGN